MIISLQLQILTYLMDNLDEFAILFAGKAFFARKFLAKDDSKR